MSLFADLLKSLAPVGLKVLEQIGDSQINGAELSPKQKASVWNARNLLLTYGKDLAASSDNEYDDMAISELLTLAEDTLGEAGIALTPIPDFGIEPAG